MKIPRIKTIRINENSNGRELMIVFDNDRFNAVLLENGATQKDVACQLYLLSDMIANDEHLKTESI